jgi:V8-like Glu-specific endopeptidase
MGTELNPGITYGLANDWLIDSSENYPLDQDPPADRLDYALLRLAEAAGNDTVGDKSNSAGNKRGFIAWPANPFNPVAGSGLSIMQHPRGDPLKLVLDDDGVMSLNGNQTRLRYETNTERGSSGSPCFTFKWELVALHHSGDPDFDPAHKPAYNEGIPMTAITKLLKKREIGAKIVAHEN